MANVNEQKCPTCGAPLRFDPERGLLVCDYCGAAAELGKPETATQGAEMEGFDFDSLNEQATDPDAADLPVYNCVSCGAEVIAPAEQIALTCPYCRNNIVLTDKVSGKLRPDGVIPFRISSKQLPDAMNRFYRNKKLLPKNFFTESSVGSVTGVYVPFWTFSGRLSGRLVYDAERSSSHRSGDYVVTDTKHYKLTRDVAVDFNDLPVDASDKIEDALMDSLEPFEMADVKPFDMSYLAGFTADRFDQGAQDIAPRAQQRMRITAMNRAAVRAGAGYSGVHLCGGNLRADLKARYLLFPVYLFSIKHGGKDYSFAVNGQTGKVVGELPIDKGVSRTYFLVRAGAVLGAAVLLSIAKYMLGW
jgi:DNA-directed RNA polymerase subunit RPC12/RpoP